jgi:hypothetical protein
MKSARLMIAAVLTVLLVIPSASVFDMSSADEPQDDAPTFSRAIPDQVLAGMDEITDAMTKRIDNLPLPPGSATVLEAVVDDRTSRPRTGAVTAHVDYSMDEEIDELRIAEGADICVDDGVTVTVDRLYVESDGGGISFSTEGTGRMVVRSLMIEGLIIPLFDVAVSADDMSLTAEYRRDGEDRSFSLTVSYVHELRVTMGDYTVTYSSEDPAEIGIAVDLDLTDYVSRTGAPDTLSTVDRLLWYVGSLDLIRIDAKIKVGGSYGISDYPMPFSVSDLELEIGSHKDSAVPHYSIALSIGNVRTYPVDITGMSIRMDLPASKMRDGSIPSMDRSWDFVLTGEHISVERIEPDDPLSVDVAGLALTKMSEPEPKLSLEMTEMAYTETVTDESGTFDVSTTVSGFDADFNGISSEILDDTKGLMRKIISGTAVDGTLSLERVTYSRYDAANRSMVEQATVAGLEVQVRLAIPEFSLRFDIGSFEYIDADREISCASVSFDPWVSIGPSFNPEIADNIRELLELFTVRSVMEVTAESDSEYSVPIDEGRAFLTELSTDGLRALCGIDTITLDKSAVRELASAGPAEVGFHRLTEEEIQEEVPSKLRNQLSGGPIIELASPSFHGELIGMMAVSIATDLDPHRSGTYYLDVDSGRLEKRDQTVKDGYVIFETDTMGLYAVSGPLTKPDRTAFAFALLIAAAALGAVTVLLGNRFITRGGDR